MRTQFVPCPYLPTANLRGEAGTASGARFLGFYPTTGTVILGLDPGIQCQELNTDTMHRASFAPICQQLT